MICSLITSVLLPDDSKLASRLASELSYEQENSNNDEEPEFLAAFKSSGVWSVEDKIGADEVALTRKFGNEQIKVLFSIADIDNAPESSSSASTNAKNGEEAAEDAAEEDQSEAEAEQGASLPIRTAITITKVRTFCTVAQTNAENLISL